MVPPSYFKRTFMTKESEIMRRLSMSFKEEDKIAVFIDGYNTLRAARKLNLKIDWLRFSDLFKYLCRVVSFNFYISNINGADDFKGLNDWLSFNGFKVTVAEGHRYEYADCNTEQPLKSYKTGYDSEIVIDALSIANKVDKIVILSSNPDLCSLVVALQRLGVSVVLITNSATKLKSLVDNPTPAYEREAATSLIRTCNEFYELADLIPEIENVTLDTKT